MKKDVSLTIEVKMRNGSMVFNTTLKTLQSTRNCLGRLLFPYRSQPICWIDGWLAGYCQCMGLFAEAETLDKASEEAAAFFFAVSKMDGLESYADVSSQWDKALRRVEDGVRKGDTFAI